MSSDSRQHSDPAPPCVVAVIVHFGDPGLTWRAIASLPDAWRGGAIDRVVLVENDPSNPAADACSAELDNASLPPVEAIGPPRNRGYGGAINECLATLDPARESWLLIVNNDAIMEPGSIDALLAAADEQPGAAIFAPLITSPVERSGDGGVERIWAEGGVWQPSRARAFNRNYDAPLSKAPGTAASAVEQEFVSGCIMLCRTAHLQSIGGFDAAFFLYYEDVDLCLRLAAGAGQSATHPPAIFVPAARARHDVSQGLRFSPRQTYYNWRNRWWVARRHLRGSTRLAALGYLAAMTLLHPLIRRESPWFGHLAARWRALFDGALGSLPASPSEIRPRPRSVASPDPPNRNES